MNSHLQETRTSTLPCRLVHVAKAPRRIWKNTLRTSLIVRLLDRVALVTFTYSSPRYFGRAGQTWPARAPGDTPAG